MFDILIWLFCLRYFGNLPSFRLVYPEFQVHRR